MNRDGQDTPPKELSFLDALNKYFKLAELEELCFSIGINYEEIPGTTLSEKTRGLILYCSRHNLINELIDYANDKRPFIDWESLPIPKEHTLNSSNIFRFVNKKNMLIGILLLSVLLFLGLMFRPNMIIYFNEEGLAAYEGRNFTLAQRNFQRALFLDPQNGEILYNLGSLYEDQIKQDGANVSLALDAYTKSSETGFEGAFNNAARLYILFDQPDEAVQLAQAGLAQASNTTVRYYLYKNLGWARYSQNSYPDAIANLNESIQLNPSPASPYCLLALVYDAQELVNQAEVQWRQCVARADNSIPEEDEWRQMGQERLTQGEDE